MAKVIRKIELTDEETMALKIVEKIFQNIKDEIGEEDITYFENCDLITNIVEIANYIGY